MVEPINPTQFSTMYAKDAPRRKSSLSGSSSSSSSDSDSNEAHTKRQHECTEDSATLLIEVAQSTCKRVKLEKLDIDNALLLMTRIHSGIAKADVDTLSDAKKLHEMLQAYKTDELSN
ncbi:MAG: hypothetical protein MUO31_05445 [Thermodesulfovibrionales bacterium]|nr:hypothetical protein [Thermodesulfovibrionales bacterium]